MAVGYKVGSISRDTTVSNANWVPHVTAGFLSSGIAVPLCPILLATVAAFTSYATFVSDNATE